MQHWRETTEHLGGSCWIWQSVPDRGNNGGVTLEKKRRWKEEVQIVEQSKIVQSDLGGPTKTRQSGTGGPSHPGLEQWGLAAKFGGLEVNWGLAFWHRGIHIAHTGKSGPYCDCSPRSWLDIARISNFVLPHLPRSSLYLKMNETRLKAHIPSVALHRMFLSDYHIHQQPVEISSVR